MWRTLFLILVLTSLGVFAQAQENSIQNETPTAVKIEEFGNEPNGYIKMLTDNYIIKLQNEPTSQGYIISYGLNKPIARRKTFLRNYILMRGFNEQRITFVTGGFSKEIKTEFWVVPQGAESPKLVPAAKIFAEIGVATTQKFKELFEKFYNAPGMESTATAYIINYGNASNTAVREKQIRNSIGRGCDFGCPRLVIVNGGKARVLRTVFWIVPEGAEPPTP